MARARLIKPGFYSNEQLSDCSILARFIFPGLWMLADRRGRLEDRPKRIKGELLPYDDADVDVLLGELATMGLLVRYQVNGTRLIQVCCFEKHQSCHPREVESELPAPGGHADSIYTAGHVSDEVRADVMARDGARCVECSAEDNLSIDHIVPRSSGGSHEASNLQVLCGMCNARKGNRKSLDSPKANLGCHKVLPSPSEAVALAEALALAVPVVVPEAVEPKSVPATSPKTGEDRGDEKQATDEARALRASTWKSYSDAYFARYGVEPVRNKTVNSQVVSLCGRLGTDSPAVAANYLRSNSSFYVGKGHALGQLLADCEKLRTEWATGRSVTQSEARTADKQQGNAFARVLRKDGTNG